MYSPSILCGKLERLPLGYLLVEVLDYRCESGSVIPFYGLLLSAYPDPLVGRRVRLSAYVPSRSFSFIQLCSGDIFLVLLRMISWSLCLSRAFPGVRGLLNGSEESLSCLLNHIGR